ncbi:MAG: MFS transporter [Armatimonadota bacterium]|nr:MFS transporter [Armatimonadota bacterium]
MIPSRLVHTRQVLADASGTGRLRRSIGHSFRTLRIRDFKLYWIGAFLSFVGSWVQNTGQQWLVFDLTNSEQALGLMTFIGAAPMFFLSPFGGWLADRANKRMVLVVCQATFAISAFVLAFAVWQGFATFWMITGMAFVNGCTSVIEIPTRQSMISNLVPSEDLASALPLSAATFNTARILGPAIGGLLLGTYGPAACYLINGLSFSAIIFAVLAIRADLRSTSDRSASLKESLFEGIRHVYATPAFRTLVFMMMVTAVCAMFYISLVSAFAGRVLNVGAQGFGYLLTSTGVGAIIGLLTITWLSSKPVKGWIPIIAMCGLGGSLVIVSLTHEMWQSCLALGMMGVFGVGQMVGTNTALQYFSPPELRGRIISVHVWSMAGLNPVGALLFGKVAEEIGLPITFRIGGFIVLFVGILTLLFAKSLKALR